LTRTNRPRTPPVAIRDAVDQLDDRLTKIAAGDPAMGDGYHSVTCMI
jgi:hypothetical protein